LSGKQTEGDSQQRADTGGPFTQTLDQAMHSIR
jgi:hypothetical protein